MYFQRILVQEHDHMYMHMYMYKHAHVHVSKGGNILPVLIIIIEFVLNTG